MQLDPAADPARRIQLRCTPCRADNTLHMIASRANLVLVACTNCQALYWVDTGCGHGRPPDVEQLQLWPL